MKSIFNQISFIFCGTEIIMFCVTLDTSSISVKSSGVCLIYLVKTPFFSMGGCHPQLTTSIFFPIWFTF